MTNLSYLIKCPSKILSFEVESPNVANTSLICKDDIQRCPAWLPTDQRNQPTQDGWRNNPQIPITEIGTMFQTPAKRYVSILGMVRISGCGSWPDIQLWFYGRYTALVLSRISGFSARPDIRLQYQAGYPAVV